MIITSSVRMAIIKRQEVTSVGMHAEKKTLDGCWWACKLVQLTVENNMKVSQKIKK